MKKSPNLFSIRAENMVLSQHAKKKGNSVPFTAKMTNLSCCKDAPPFDPGKCSRKVKRTRIKFCPIEK